ncbi:MAG: type II toxin-antitoxin system VapC family toxin [Dermatophilaceae bacterium]
MAEPTRGLLDTSTLIDLPDLPADLLPDSSAISTVTLAELAAGPHATTDPVERAIRQQRVQWAEATFDALPFDRDAARVYGHLSALVVAAGHTPRRRVADLQIAATAAAAGLPLFTRNPADFAGLHLALTVIPL